MLVVVAVVVNGAVVVVALPCHFLGFLPSFLRFVRFKKKKGIKVFLGKPKEIARNPSKM